MNIRIEYIENPENLFWISDLKISNKSNSRIYPDEISIFANGKSVAIYEYNTQGTETQIAQLLCIDYIKLKEAYENENIINLNYAYIDNFTWLGDKKPYEVEREPYKKIRKFSAACSFWNYSLEDNRENYIHLMQAEILEMNMDFSYAVFNNIKLAFTNLKITSGNLDFSDIKLFESSISIFGVECGGNRLFPSEISFRYIITKNSSIVIWLFTNVISIDFLCAKLEDGKVTIDAVNARLTEVCFTKASILTLEITNAQINTFDIREANIKELALIRCTFLGISTIDLKSQKVVLNDCVLSNIFKFNVSEANEISFDHTVSNGRLPHAHFDGHQIVIV